MDRHSPPPPAAPNPTPDAEVPDGDGGAPGDPDEDAIVPQQAPLIPNAPSIVHETSPDPEYPPDLSPFIDLDLPLTSHPVDFLYPFGYEERGDEPGFDDGEGPLHYPNAIGRPILWDSWAQALEDAPEVSPEMVDFAHARGAALEAWMVDHRLERRRQETGAAAEEEEGNNTAASAPALQNGNPDAIVVDWPAAIDQTTGSTHYQAVRSTVAGRLPTLASPSLSQPPPPPRPGTGLAAQWDAHPKHTPLPAADPRLVGASSRKRKLDCQRAAARRIVKRMACAQARNLLNDSQRAAVKAAAQQEISAWEVAPLRGCQGGPHLGGTTYVQELDIAMYRRAAAIAGFQSARTAEDRLQHATLHDSMNAKIKGLRTSRSDHLCRFRDRMLEAAAAEQKCRDVAAASTTPSTGNASLSTIPGCRRGGSPSRTADAGAHHPASRPSDLEQEDEEEPPPGWRPPPDELAPQVPANAEDQEEEEEQSDEKWGA